MSETFDPHEWRTPLYVYDLAATRTAVGALRSQLPQPSSLFFSLKANPHPAVVRALHQRGCHMEVSSLGELRAAQDAEVPGDHILYTGPGKTATELEAALAAEVRLFSVDSPTGLDLLATQARRAGTTARYLLRINPSEPVSAAGLRMTGAASQFGADEADVIASPERYLGRDGLEPHGLHLYLATNLTDESALVEQFRVAIRTAGRLQSRLNTPLRLLDLGGGFGAPYARDGSLPRFPFLHVAVGRLLDETFPGWRRGRPVVMFESGRHLTATCGRLFTRVVDAKISRERRVVVVDSGIHHLGGMAGLRRVPPFQVDVVPHHRTNEGGVTETMVCGPLCTPLDTWTRQAALTPVRAGDLLVVPNVGAYGLSASLALFLGHPLPTELIVDGRHVVEASRLTVHRQPLPSTSAPFQRTVTAIGGH